MKGMTTECALCGDHAELQDSHLVPGFVGRWLKETSATGYLRTAVAPNRRVEDLVKVPLLCSQCEQLFSGWETKFAAHLFRPFHDGRRTFDYDDWLLKFAVSLSWRCLAGVQIDWAAEDPKLVEVAQAARTRFSGYLQGQADARNLRSRFNLFFVSLGATSALPLPDGWSFYFMRGVDMTPILGSGRLATYVMLPGMIFWTSILPAEPRGWTGTKINRHGTLRARKQELSEPGVGDFLMERVVAINAKKATTSPRQSAKIGESVRSAGLRALESKSMEAWQDDLRIQIENTRKDTGR